MRLKTNTFDESTRRRMPKPTSCFGRHTSSQATFAFLLEFGEPDQRKALHMLSIVSRQRFGNLKAEHQKFIILTIIEFIS